MKRFLIALSALAAISVYAAQDTSLTLKEVRDPRQLKAWLEANASDAQTRIAAKETTGVTNVTAQTASVAGTVTLTMATNTTYYLDASTNVATNIVIYVSGVAVTTAGVTTNVAVSR